MTTAVPGPAGVGVGAAFADRGLTVVIPVRNAGDCITAQLQALSLAPPPEAGVQIIVADNGSTDGTARIVEQFSGDIEVRLVDASRTVGSNYARNCGVQQARSHWIALCDADDEVDPDWLLTVCRAFEDGHELVAGRIDYRRLNAREVQQWRGSPGSGVLPVMRFLPAGHGANLAFTRRVYDAVGGFDEDFTFGGPDVEFCWRAQLAGFTLHYEPDAVVHYRLRRDLRAHFAQARLYGAAEAHLFRKFRSRGVRRRSLAALGGEIWWLASRLPFAAPVGRRGAWLRRLGQQLGRWEGSIRYRVLWW